MAQYPLGIIIRQRRDMLGLSQQQLCQGICDRSTLSRIERGDQVPAYSTLRALLQRLGLQKKDVHFLLGQPDFETAQLQREIVALNTRKQWLQAQQKIRQLQALPTAADPLTRQFILRAKALAGYEQDGKAVPYPYEEQRQMLLEALQISCPGIDPEHLQGHLLGEEEGKLLNQMLERIGLAREDIYIANILKCRPPGNRDPKPEEIEVCTPWLREQVKAVHPTVLVTMGNFSTKFILQTNTGITRLRGKIHVTGPFRVIPTFHPAAAIYDRSKIGAIEQDFDLIKLLLDTDAAREKAGRDDEEANHD